METPVAEPADVAETPVAEPADTAETPVTEIQATQCAHKPEDILGSKPKPVYAALDNLSNTIANHAKGVLYSPHNFFLRNKEVTVILRKLSSSPCVLTENHAKQYSMEECAHQFIRSFLHMHDEQLHAVIAHM